MNQGLVILLFPVCEILNWTWTAIYLLSVKEREYKLCENLTLCSFFAKWFLKIYIFFDQTCQSLSVSFKPYSILLWVFEGIFFFLCNSGLSYFWGNWISLYIYIYIFFLLTSFTCLAPEQFKLNLHLLNQNLFYFGAATVTTCIYFVSRHVIIHYCKSNKIYCTVSWSLSQNTSLQSDTMWFSDDDWLTVYLQTMHQ